MKWKYPTWTGLVPVLIAMSVTGCGGGGSASASPSFTPTADNPYGAQQVYILTKGYQDQSGGTALTPSGSGHLTAEGYAFAAGEGLELTNPLGGAARESYSMDVVFKFDAVDSYARVLDFSNLSADGGLYVLGGALVFYGVPGSGGGGEPLQLPAAGPITPGTWTHIVITRLGTTGHILGYVNGDLVWDLDDSTEGVSKLPAGNPLWIFKDDGGENSGGAARLVRLYGSPLSASQVKALANTQVNP